MKNKNIFVVLLLALCLLTNASAQDSKKLTLDLFLDWEYALNPQISPDGTQIIYTRRWTDKVNDKYENDVWIVNADGTRNRFLLKGASPANTDFCQVAGHSRHRNTSYQTRTRSDKSAMVARRKIYRL
jgi:dipeptidyl aminopeptidase/acylaminoacyl peptidase